MNMSNRFKRSKVQVFVISALTVLMSNISFANEKLPELPAITIQVDKEGAKSKTNVVTTEIANKRTETDLRGLLKDEPSIHFGGGNGTSQWFNIRGLGQDQIDVKVDGAYSDTQIFHHQGRFSLDPSLVKIVKVQKGTGSASAGIGATGGSVEAKTLDAKELLEKSNNPNFGMKVNAGYASNDGHSYGASVFGKTGMVDVLVAGNWTNDEDYKAGKGYRNVDDSNVVKLSALNQRGLLAKIGADFDNHRVVLSHREELHKGVRALREEFDGSQSTFNMLKDDYDKSKYLQANYRLGKLQREVKTGEAGGRKCTDVNPCQYYWVLDKDGTPAANDVMNSPTYRETSNKQTTVEWSADNLGFINKANANISMLTNRRYTPAYINIINEQPQSASDIKIETYTANLNLESHINDKSSLKYGVNWRKQIGKPTTLAKNVHQQQKIDTGVYVEAINDFGKAKLTTGLRYDHFDFTAMSGKQSSKGVFNPSIGLIYQISPALSVNGSVNYATRSPRFQEVMLAGGAGRGLYSLADDIKPEKSRNTEIGFNYDDGTFSAEGSYYWHRIDDYHASSCKEVNKQRICTINNDGGQLKNRGYELSGAYRWHGLTTRLSVADSKPRRNGQVSDTRASAVPIGRTWTSSLSYNFEQPNVEVGWRGRFVETEEYRNANNINVRRAGYNLNDFYANWKPLSNDRLNVNFAINNAFNKYYKSHSQSTGGNALAGAGRDIRVGFNYTF